MVFSADPIDIVTDPIPPHEYKVEEDTRLFRSAKTQRGPLRDDWIEEYNNNPGKTPIMCAYKLCKVEFRYWGMQSKIERFIHDVGRSQRFHSQTSLLSYSSYVDTFRIDCSTFCSCVQMRLCVLFSTFRP